MIADPTLQVYTVQGIFKNTTNIFGRQIYKLEIDISSEYKNELWIVLKLYLSNDSQLEICNSFGHHFYLCSDEINVLSLVLDPSSTTVTSWDESTSFLRYVAFRCLFPFIMKRMPFWCSPNSLLLCLLLFSSDHSKRSCDFQLRIFSFFFHSCLQAPLPNFRYFEFAYLQRLERSQQSSIHARCYIFFPPIQGVPDVVSMEPCGEASVDEARRIWQIQFV